MGLTIKPPPAKHRVHEPITIARVEFGVDWGRERRLIAKRTIRGKLVGLFIVPGHSCWSGNGMPWRYAATKLVLASDMRGYHCRTLCEGRISMKAIQAHGDKIADVFELPHIMQLIALDRTVEVEPVT